MLERGYAFEPFRARYQLRKHNAEAVECSPAEATYSAASGCFPIDKLCTASADACWEDTLAVCHAQGHPMAPYWPSAISASREMHESGETK
jgi:hypothetical protein